MDEYTSCSPVAGPSVPDWAVSSRRAGGRAGANLSGAETQAGGLARAARGGVGVGVGGGAGAGGGGKGTSCTEPSELRLRMGQENWCRKWMR